MISFNNVYDRYEVIILLIEAENLDCIGFRAVRT